MKKFSAIFWLEFYRQLAGFLKRSSPLTFNENRMLSFCINSPETTCTPVYMYLAPCDFIISHKKSGQIVKNYVIVYEEAKKQRGWLPPR